MLMKEASAKYELSPDTLRYYERIGLLPTVTRNASGIRDYQDEDCKWIEFIKCMRSAGLPIEALIEYVHLFQQGDSTNAARKDILSEQRNLLKQRMDELSKTLKRLDDKISNYEKKLMVSEQAFYPTDDNES